MNNTASNKCSEIKISDELDQIQLKYQRKFRSDIAEICEPIFKLLGVTFFSHTRAFHDGQFSCLLTLPELTEYFIKNKFPIVFSQGSGFILEHGYYIADYINSILSQQLRLHLTEQFNIDHFLYIIEKGINYDDMYVFATNPSNGCIINHYFNERELINHFILYYKDKTTRIIKNADTLRYSKEFFSTEEFLSSMSKINVHQRENCANEMSINKVHMVGNLGEVVIARREFDCLKLIVKNYTLKEIGKRLSISPRTVETYFQNLKNKLGCDRKEQLVDLFYEFIE